MNDLGNGAVIAVGITYLAKSIYELVRQRNGRASSKRCSDEVLQVLANLSIAQVGQTGILKEIAKTQSTMAVATQLIAERTAILKDRGERG